MSIIQNPAVIAALVSSARKELEKTERVNGIAETFSKAIDKVGFTALPDGRYVIENFEEYAETDDVSTKEGKAKLKRELAALGSAMSDYGFTRRATDARRNWEYLSINKAGKHNVKHGKKVGYTHELYFDKARAIADGKYTDGETKPTPKKVRARKPKQVETDTTATDTNTSTVSE